jgi:DNA mismatch endonuclease (patch repair protein)
MVDVLSKEQRKKCMQAIKGRHSKPELAIRQLVFAMGFRFRLHRKDLPGCPDLVFTKRRSVIFVHGCFWHMHDCPAGRSTPVNNSAFWKAKRERNVARDLEIQGRLGSQGWRALVVWTCELKRPEEVEMRIREFLLSSARTAAKAAKAGIL